jgi:hypothetical protein
VGECPDVGQPGPLRPLARRLRRSALAAVVMVLLMPGVASAHTGGRIATDFDARIGGFSPAAPGVRARVLGGDLKLELTVSGDHTVVVLGLLGEPFLRFSPAGVAANAASPTAWNSGVVGSGDAVRSASAPVWRRVSRGHTFAWHEGRLRPQTAPSGGATPRRVARWSVALVVDGRPTRVRGWEWYATGPPLLPWAVAAAAALAAAAAAVRYCSRAAQRAIAAALVPTAVAAWLAGWVGILLWGSPSPVVIVLAAAYAAVTVALVAAALTATGGNARMTTAGIVGGLAAVFTVPEVDAFTRGFVFSALGGTGARTAALVSFAGGVALAAVCAPAMSDILSDDPLRRRLLAHRPADR